MRRNPTLFPQMGVITTIAMIAAMVGTIFFGAAMAYDSVGMLRAAAAGNLTATETGTGKQIDGTPATGVVVRVHVPQATGTSPTCDITIQASDTLGSGYTTVVTFDQITIAGEYRRHFTSPKKYARYVATIAGTTPNFGAVQIGFEAAGEQSAI